MDERVGWRFRQAKRRDKMLMGGSKVDLPIKFPSEADVIAEEAARFRKLSPSDRIKAIQKCCNDFELSLKMSGREAEFLRLADAEKQREREAILKFIARHHPNQLLGEPWSLDENGTPDRPIIIEPTLERCS
jgi:hypothetical protein